MVAGPLVLAFGATAAASCCCKMAAGDDTDTGAEPCSRGGVVSRGGCGARDKELWDVDNAAVAAVGVTLAFRSAE